MKSSLAITLSYPILKTFQFYPLPAQVGVCFYHLFHELILLQFLCCPIFTYRESCIKTHSTCHHFLSKAQHAWKLKGKSKKMRSTYNNFAENSGANPKFGKEQILTLVTFFLLQLHYAQKLGTRLHSLKPNIAKNPLAVILFSIDCC